MEMRAILSREVGNIEEEAWQLLGVERTTEAANELRENIYRALYYYVGVEHLHLDPPPGIDYSTPPPRLTYAQMALHCVSKCRAALSQWGFHEVWNMPYEAVSELAEASKYVGMARCDDDFHAITEYVAAESARRALSDAGRKAAQASHAKDLEKAENIKAWYRREHAQGRKGIGAAAEKAFSIFNVAYTTAYRHIAAEAKIIRGEKA